MTFSEFAGVLYTFLGDDMTTADFTKALLMSVTDEEVKPLLKEISPNTYKSYFNGHRSLSGISRRLIGHLELEQFADFLKAQSEWVKEDIGNTLDRIDASNDVGIFNCHIACANIFHEIILEACLAKRRSPSQAHKH